MDGRTEGQTGHRTAMCLYAGGVDMYFNGHDHILQHIVRDGIHYIGSGAGARVHHMANRFYEGLKYAHVSHFGYTAHSGELQTTT